MNKKQLIIGGAILVGVALLSVYLVKRKKATATPETPSTPSDSVEEADATYFATNTPDINDGTGKAFEFIPRIGVYMPKPTPEMSIANQEIDLTV